MRKSIIIAFIFIIFSFLIGFSFHTDKDDAKGICGFCSLSFDYSLRLVSDIVPALCEPSIVVKNESHSNSKQVALSGVPDRAPPVVS